MLVLLAAVATMLLLMGAGIPDDSMIEAAAASDSAAALDMMEELRAPVCDRLAIALLNRKQITEASFEQLNAPVLLNEDGRKTVLSAWQKRKQETIRHPFLEETVPVGLIPHVQAKLLARVLRGELDEYPLMVWR